MSLDDAARKAIDECIEEGVLADFFIKQKKEALEMSLFDVDIDEYDKVKYCDGFEDGKAEAQSIFFYNMIEEGIEIKRAQRLAGLDDETAERMVRERNGYM